MTGLAIALVAAWIGWVAPALAAGTLKLAVPSNLNTLDPAKTKIGEEYIVNFLAFSGLTEIGRDGRVKAGSRGTGPMMWLDLRQVSMQ